MTLASSMDLVVFIGSLLAGIVALLTLLKLLKQHWQKIPYWLRRWKRKKVLQHLTGTYTQLGEGIEARRHDDITLLVNTGLFLNDGWPSSSGIRWRVVGDSSPEIETGLLKNFQDTKKYIMTMQGNVKIYWRHMFSIWEILSFDISREALGRGYVTSKWLDAAEDWRICLIALQETIRSNSLGEGLSDAPAVALLERVRNLSAEGALFSPAKAGDVFYFHVSLEETLGPYCVSTDPVEIGLLPSPGSGGRQIIPLLQLELEDCTGERKELTWPGSKGSFAPVKKFTPGERKVEQFPPNFDEIIMFL